MVRGAVQEQLASALAKAPGEVVGAALTVSVSLGVAVPADKLTKWIADEAQPTSLRLAALAQLPADQLLRFSTDKLPALRAAAAERAATQFPEQAATLAKGLLERATGEDLIAAYGILAQSKTEETAAVLAGELTRLAAGEVPEGQSLELLEAAASRAEPAVQDQLAAYEKKLSEKGQSVYDLTLSGGDVGRGRAVFANQGTCLKCHRAEGEGGNAGPRLTGLALRNSPAQMLDSVLYPNHVVMPGYGISVLTLEDGNVVVGSPTEETAEALTLRTPEGEVKQIAKSTIKEQTPPVSPMPPVGMSLTKRDMRDLMAFLSHLTKPLPELK